MRPGPHKETSGPTSAAESREELLISSVNIEGLKSNVTGLQNLMKSSHFICIQEHWLWGYEQKDIALYIDDWCYHIVSSDVLFPVPKSERRRGYGGVAIVWRKELQNNVRILDEGNDRILAVEYKTEFLPICLICAYMPTSGYAETAENYSACVDLLSVVVSKYRDTHLVVVSGDMNATVLSSRSSNSDKQFRKFVETEGLKVCTPGDHMTYSHGNGASQIDYILSSADIPVQFALLDVVEGNTSSHIPIQCAFKIRHSLVNVKDVEKKLHRTLWDSCDRRLFQQVILSSNTACDIQKPSDIDSSVAILQSSLLQAESCAVEKKKLRLCGPKWKASPPVNNILRQRRHLYRKWIQSDKPGPEHPISIELLSLKRELRRTQRKERATERTTFYNSIMESENTANFYRLVNRNSRGSRSTVALLENGKRLTDPKEQCRGFASFYEDLAIPRDSSSFDADYKSRISADLHLIRQTAENTCEPVPVVTSSEVEQAIKKLHTKKASDEFGLVSEHLKMAGNAVTQPIALIFSEILRMKHIPEQFHSGVLHPIHKKGKDPSLYTNYRGITVTSLVGKVFEHVVLEKIQSCLPKSQSSLQYGFTKGLLSAYGGASIVRNYSRVTRS